MLPNVSVPAHNEPVKTFAAYANAMPSACLLVNVADGLVLHSNPRAARLLGRDIGQTAITEWTAQAETIEKSLRQFSASITSTPSRWQLKINDQILDVQATGARVGSEAGLSETAVLVTLQLHRHSSNGVFSELSTQLDGIRRERFRLLQDNKALEARVTERTISLQLKNDQLDALNKSLSDFVSMVSHDLAGPARRIQSFSDLLQKRLKAEQLDEDSSEFLRYLSDSAARLTLMIEGLVRLSRLKPQLDRWSYVNLNDLLDTVTKDVDALHGETTVNIQREQLDQVYGDAGQIQQVLLNLMNNAIKFRLPGQPASIMVSTESRPETKQVVLVVRDQGMGIHPGEFDRVLQPFLRGSGAEQQPGTGLGLSMCLRICQLHEGDLWVENSRFFEQQQPSGTEIRLTLPASPLEG